jgi:transketolase
MTEKLLANEFNKPGHNIVDHHTYVFLGDGCLMEGVSHEACALAGTWGLGKLIAFWDDNGISIDGHIEGWYTDDTAKRFESYGWHAIRDVDGHDPDAVEKAIEEAKKITDKPTMICCKTVIGKGSPNKSGTHNCHGAALGDDEVALVRKEIGWDHPPFVIPQDVYDGWNQKEKGQIKEDEWNVRFDAYTKEFPDLASEFNRRMANELPANWKKLSESLIKEANSKAEKMATRKASQNTITSLAELLPEFIGGSADLTGSNLTSCPSFKHVSGKEPGNYISYGVREFGMAAIMNGMALHGGVLPFGGTFHIFTDYMRNGMRMAALMKQRVVYVLTHDSIGQGEDGPTHQPIETTSSLRYIPRMEVWRPCDSTEVSTAWVAAIENLENPTSLVLSRQGTSFIPRTDSQITDIRKGGYVLSDSDGIADVIIIATGSEVGLAMDSQAALKDTGVNARVVSMPCTHAFDRQEEKYQDSVLTPGVKRVSIEAGVTDFWKKYVGLDGASVGINTYGESAPGADLFKHFGFTVENVVKTVKSIV